MERSSDERIENAAPVCLSCLKACNDAVIIKYRTIIKPLENEQEKWAKEAMGASSSAVNSFCFKLGANDACAHDGINHVAGQKHLFGTR